MIDLGILTWTQQWEYWIFSRMLRPVEFGHIWRWDYLLVPDQVWLLVGAYRVIRHMFVTEGPIWGRVTSLGSVMRTDPIIFIAFGLMFIAEPHFRRRRRNLEGAVIAMDAGIDPGDIDGALIAEDDTQEVPDTLDPSHANEIEQSQAGNTVILPASVLRTCRCCHNRTIVATNLLPGCGHFPFCNQCVSRESFRCPVCVGKGLKEVGPANPMGMTSTDLAKPPSVVQVNEKVSVAKSCAVCQEREGLLTLMPCGHLLFCGPCVLGFRRCPYCSTRIVRAIRGFDVRHNELANK